MNRTKLDESDSVILNVLTRSDSKYVYDLILLHVMNMYTHTKEF